MALRTVPVSGNAKTGKMAVTYRQVGETCPSTCPFLGNGCYAQHGNVNIWQARSEYSNKDGISLFRFVMSLPDNYMLRHHVSGDVMLNDSVDWGYIEWMNKSASARPDIVQFAYTHAWKQIGVSPFRGVTVNASCETVEDVKLAKSLGYPATMVVKSTEERKSWREDGIKFRVCPQQTNGVKCSTCKLCTNPNRESVVVFLAHGSAKTKVNNVLN